GAVFFGLGIGSALYAVTASADRGWTDWQVLGFGLAGLIVLAIFVRHEATTTYPLYEMRLLRDKKVRASMIVSIILGFGPLGMFTVLSATISRQPNAVDGTTIGVGIGLSPMAFGLWTAAFSAVAFLLAGAIGRMTTKYGARSTLVTGSGLAFIGVLLIAVFPANTFVVLSAVLVFTICCSFLFLVIP